MIVISRGVNSLKSKKWNIDSIFSCKDIILLAFLVRIIMLLTIFILGDTFPDGFIGSSNNDDARYEAGGLLYANMASSIIDVEAFTNAYASLGDWIGYGLATPFSSTPLWYWIVFIIIYIFHTEWSVRFFNILIASFAIKYVYEFAEVATNKQIAIHTSLLLALLPYPVIFSCFSYKDQLVMFIVFYMLNISAKYRYEIFIKKRQKVMFLLLTLAFFLIRSGVSAIVLLICLFIAFSKKLNKNKINILTLFSIIIGIVIGGILLYISRDIIEYKLNWYMLRHIDTIGNATISFITINSIFDFYKLPFTYIFSMIMPINLFDTIENWYSIVSNLNIIMCPIAIGSFFSLFKEKKDKVVYWGILVIFIITIITSINTFRHYYSLLPIILMNFCSFRVTASRQSYIVYVLATIAFISIIVLFYGFKN